jgi:hypothetical protein
MVNAATKRAILRWIHMIAAIPILGYVYGPAAEVEQYAAAARFAFVPIIMLSGYWMYSGVAFAVVGVSLWLGAILVSGSGTAILSQVALFVARKIWLMTRARPSKPATVPPVVRE